MLAAPLGSTNTRGSKVHADINEEQSSVNWAQDIADFVTFYHLTHKLNNPYKIVITFSGQEALTIEPMNSAEVRKRFDSIAMFYRE